MLATSSAASDREVGGGRAVPVTRAPVDDLPVRLEQDRERVEPRAIVPQGRVLLEDVQTGRAPSRLYSPGDRNHHRRSRWRLDVAEVAEEDVARGDQVASTPG